MISEWLLSADLVLCLVQSTIQYVEGRKGKPPMMGKKGQMPKDIIEDYRCGVAGTHRAVVLFPYYFGAKYATSIKSYGNNKIYL